MLKKVLCGAGVLAASMALANPAQAAFMVTISSGANSDIILMMEFLSLSLVRKTPRLRILCHAIILLESTSIQWLVETVSFTPWL